MVFDLLWCDGDDLRNQPLAVRQAWCRPWVPPGAPTRLKCSRRSDDGPKQGAFIAHYRLEGLIVRGKTDLHRGRVKPTKTLPVRATVTGCPVAREYTLTVTGEAAIAEWRG